MLIDAGGEKKKSCRANFFSLAFGLMAIINNWSGEICYTNEQHIYAFAFEVPAVRPQLQTYMCYMLMLSTGRCLTIDIRNNPFLQHLQILTGNRVLRLIYLQRHFHYLLF